MGDLPVSRGRGGPRGMSPRTRGGSFTSHGSPDGSFRGRPGFRGRGGSSGRSGFPRRGRPRGGSSMVRGQPFRGSPQGRGAYRSSLPTGGPWGDGSEHNYPSDGVPAPKRSRWDTPNSGEEKNAYRRSYTMESSICGTTSARGTGYQDTTGYGRFDKPVSAADTYIPSSSDDMYASSRNMDQYSSQEPNYNRFRSGAEPHELSQSTDPYSRPRNAAYGTSRNFDPYGTQKFDNPYSVSQGSDTYNRMNAEDDYGGGRTILASYNSSTYSGGRTTPPDIYGGWGSYTVGSGYEQQYDSGASRAPSDDRYGYGNYRGASSYDKARDNCNDTSAGYGPSRAGGGPFPPRRY
ncbi:stress protein DDR48-like, partial [Limulus polyphemus]|uniref:Stress protein DDR48-like n=1 Tax=Limulus polyphemus TaxID=6850 RepID=A0ABM1BJE4_LIMPO